MAIWLTPTYIVLAFACVVLALLGLLIASYVRARSLTEEIRRQSHKVGDLLTKIDRVEGEQAFVIDFMRELPVLTGELNNSMNPRGIPQVLLNVLIRTFEPEQALVMVRRNKTLAQPEGNRQFVAAAVAAPRASFGHGMVVTLGEGDLGFVADQDDVLDRRQLNERASAYRSAGATGIAAFRPDLAAPMRIGDKTLGLVALQNPSRNEAHGRDVFRVIAQMGAFALNNLAAYTEVKSVADVDPLTKIWNKGVLSFRLAEMVYDAEESDNSASVFLFDIDHFKNYNDVNGHVAGDRLLQVLARLVKEQTRMDDIFGRFGGEEFLLLLPGRSKSQARITAEKIRATIETYEFPLGENQPFGRLTISGGVATYPEDGRNGSELLRAADQALYQAKHAGRNKVRVAGLAGVAVATD